MGCSKNILLVCFDTDEICIPQEQVEAVGFSILCSLKFPDLRTELFQRKFFSSPLLFFFLKLDEPAVFWFVGVVFFLFSFWSSCLEERTKGVCVF